MFAVGTIFRRVSVLFACLSAGLSAPAESFSFSGINHLAGAFKGLDRWGHVFSVVEIGSVGPLPLCACWSSGNLAATTAPAEGWRVPLLESRLVPKTENSYELVQPDGVSRILWQDPKKPGQIGNGVWKGQGHESDGVLETTFRPPAQNLRLVFRQGRLVRMRIEEGTFDFAYAGRTLEKISAGGKTLLTLSSDPRHPERQEFRFADRSVASLTRSPGRAEIVTANGERQSFDYGSDGDHATVRSEAGLFSWNRYTGTVVQGDGWTYPVGERKPEWNDPPVSRRHPDGRYESYWFDLSTGKGVQHSADKTKREWAKFPSGDLYGLTRWTETFRDGKRRSREEFSYDSARRLVFNRVCTYGETTDTDETWYGPDGKPTRRRHNGKAVAP